MAQQSSALADEIEALRTVERALFKIPAGARNRVIRRMVEEYGDPAAVLNDPLHQWAAQLAEQNARGLAPADASGLLTGGGETT